MAARFSRKSINAEHVEIIRSIVPDGSKLLELGSGDGTKYLAEHFRMTSVEDDPAFLNKHDSTYVHAPIVQGCPLGTWYSPDVIRSIPRDYDAILVDGPSYRASLGRLGFWVFHGLFNTDVPIFVDDVNSEMERMTMVLTAWSLRRPYTVHRTETQDFGVIE